MKFVFRLFFKTLRLILGPVLLIGDKLTTPRGIKRPAEEQMKLDEQTQNLALYQFKTCPFSIKARRAIKRLSLNIEIRDAQKNPLHRSELEQGGGQIKVPCLRIADNSGKVTWLYESDAIIQYLNESYAA